MRKTPFDGAPSKGVFALALVLVSVLVILVVLIILVVLVVLILLIVLVLVTVFHVSMNLQKILRLTQ